jgi:hypothetical protein
LRCNKNGSHAVFIALRFCFAQTHGSIAAGILPARLRRKAASMPFLLL